MSRAKLWARSLVTYGVGSGVLSKYAATLRTMGTRFLTEGRGRLTYRKEEGQNKSYGVELDLELLV